MIKMALNWSVKDVKNHEAICYPLDNNGKRYLGPVTEALIFLTMAVGLTEITEKNAQEFYTRLAFYQSVFNVPEEDRLTYAQVRIHIGLHTNAGNQTKAQWLKRIYENHARELAYREFLVREAELKAEALDA